LFFVKSDSRFYTTAYGYGIHLESGKPKAHSLFLKVSKSHVFHIPKHLDKQEENLYVCLGSIPQLMRPEEENLAP